METVLTCVCTRELCSGEGTPAGCARFACGVLSMACSPVFKGIPTVVCNLSDRVLEQF